MKTLSEKYEKIVNKYVKQFCKKHGFDSGYWIGGDVGEMYETCDMDFNFKEMKYDIDTDQPEKNIIKWHNQAIDRNHKVSYKNYCLGLRPAAVIESERVASLEKTQKELKAIEKIFNEYMENEAKKGVK